MKSRYLERLCSAWPETNFTDLFMEEVVYCATKKVLLLKVRGHYSFNWKKGGWINARLMRDAGVSGTKICIRANKFDFNDTPKTVYKA